jgi:hypothetical protein
MMGYSGAGHFHHGRKIDNTFLAMAQDPENPHPCGVGKLFKQVGHYTEIPVIGHLLQNSMCAVAVIVG